MGYDQNRDEFKERLDQEHKWPTWYLFKFIAPSQLESQVSALFPEGTVSVKASSKGKYRSISAKMMIQSSEEVMKIYEQAYQIDGVIAL